MVGGNGAGVARSSAHVASFDCIFIVRFVERSMALDAMVTKTYAAKSLLSRISEFVYHVTGP